MFETKVENTKEDFVSQRGKDVLSKSWEYKRFCITKKKKKMFHSSFQLSHQYISDITRASDNTRS